MTVPVADPSPELLEAARDLLSHSDIGDVRPVLIDVELLVDDPEPIATVSFEPVLEHASGEGAYRNRFTFAFEFKGSADDVIARMKFVLVVDWAVAEEFTPSDEAAGFVAATTGYFAAFPYARELAQSCTARLGLDPLVLGTLNRGSLKPGAISTVVRPRRDTQQIGSDV